MSLLSLKYRRSEPLSVVLLIACRLLGAVSVVVVVWWHHYPQTTVNCIHCFKDTSAVLTLCSACPGLSQRGGALGRGARYEHAAHHHQHYQHWLYHPATNTAGHYSQSASHGEYLPRTISLTQTLLSLLTLTHSNKLIVQQNWTLPSSDFCQWPSPLPSPSPPPCSVKGWAAWWMEWGETQLLRPRKVTVVPSPRSQSNAGTSTTIHCSLSSSPALLGSQR